MAVIVAPPRNVLVTGGTGYLGQALIPELMKRGHRVRALIRPESQKKLFSGVDAWPGNPLIAEDVHRALAGRDTLVHLVGVPKPSPAKAALFLSIDAVSIQASVAAATRATPSPHLVYLSVAQPAPVMNAYVAVRQAGEALIAKQGVRATYLRPWYVLGPGHQWPRLLSPVYALLRRIPSTRDSANRLGFVTLAEMTTALLYAIEHPPEISPRIMDVPAIRAARTALE